MTSNANLTFIPSLPTVAPVCRPGQRDVYSVGRREVVKVVCELEANPMSNVNFTWTFNGTNAENIDIPTSDVYTEPRAKSTAKYVPNSEHVSIEFIRQHCND